MLKKNNSLYKKLQKIKIIKKLKMKIKKNNNEKANRNNRV